MQASGFTGEKLIHIQKQILLNVTIFDQEELLVFSIIPKLVHPCIFGIDVQTSLNMQFDVKTRQISFQHVDWDRRIQSQYGDSNLDTNDHAHINYRYDSLIIQNDHESVSTIARPQYLTMSELSIERITEKVNQL